MSEWGTTPAEILSAYAQRWERIAAERGVRMDELQARAESAEAELERLREERAKTAEQGRVAAKRYSEEAERRMVAEAEVQRLREALRGLSNVAEQYMDTGRGDLDGWIDKARALLSASPSDGGGA